MSENTGKPSSLPNQKYSMHKNLDEYFLSELGVVAGHMSFDNNLLMIEAFMKTLEQLLFAQKEGEFDNPFTHKKSEVVIDPVWVMRLKQLWNKGLHCLIIRDPHEPIHIIQRIVAYPMLEKYVKIKNREYENPWEVMSPCLECKEAIMYGFMENQSFDVTQTRCELVCSKCNMDLIVEEVEVKPPMQKMKVQREKETNAVWVETKAQIPMRYAHETTPADILCGNEGGFYKETNGIKIPRYNNSQEILLSTDNTSHPSHQYYDDTMDLMFSEWLVYFHMAFIKAHKTVTSKYGNSELSEQSSYKDMDSA